MGTGAGAAAARQEFVRWRGIVVACELVPSVRPCLFPHLASKVPLRLPLRLRLPSVPACLPGCLRSFLPSQPIMKARPCVLLLLPLLLCLPLPRASSSSLSLGIAPPGIPPLFLPSYPSICPFHCLHRPTIPLLSSLVACIPAATPCLPACILLLSIPLCFSLRLPIGIADHVWGIILDCSVAAVAR